MISSLPVHDMQSLWLLESVCEHVGKIIRNCIWGRGGHHRSWNLVTWEDVARSKAKGGLGVRYARKNNEALLGNLFHSFMNEKEKLWVQVLSHKYFRSGSILTERAQPRDSSVWRGIVKAKNSVVHGFGPRLGAASSSLWYSNWLGYFRSSLCILLI